MQKRKMISLIGSGAYLRLIQGIAKTRIFLLRAGKNRGEKR
jgi:hypothetical protein